MPRGQASLADMLTLAGPRCQAATLQLPPSLIDCILVHELAHLREANRTPEFWSIVARLMLPCETHKPPWPPPANPSGSAPSRGTNEVKNGIVGMRLQE